MSLPSPYLIAIGDETNKARIKTALGLIQWCPEKCLAYNCFNQDITSNHISIPRLSIHEAVEAGARSLVIGIVPSGGKFSDKWREYLIMALESGLNIISGLHQYLNEDTELKQIAELNNVKIYDVRKPEDKYLIMGTGKLRAGKRLLTVGTDGFIGKKYTALSINKALQERKLKSTFRATGQTGIMISGEGVAIDSVPGDFICGATEVLCPENDENHWDIIEGQGCLLSPTASSLLGFINGTQADIFIMCHDVTRKKAMRPPHQALPGFKELIDIHLYFARRKKKLASFKGFSVNTSSLDEDQAIRYLDKLEDEYCMPATDPIRFGVDKLVNKII